MDKNLGFLKTLFDFSFSSFVTTKIIKFVYILAIVLSAIGALGAIGGGFGESIGHGVLMLILSPIIFALSVLVSRIWLEIIIVIFRIAENTTELANKK